MIDPAWFQVVAGICLIIGGALSLAQSAEDAEEDEPWGYQISGSGVCDGGNYDGWEDE